MGLSARGGASQAQTGVSGVSQTISEHKEQIRQAVSDLAEGNVTPKFLQRLLKRFGWSQGKEDGSFIDPTGTTHSILPGKIEGQGQEEFKE
jgi:hypothetical protein